MAGWHHWLSRHEFEWTLGDGEGQGSLVCCSPWSHKESARLSDWTTTTVKKSGESRDWPNIQALAPVRQVVNAKEKGLKEIKSATSVNTWMIRSKSLTVEMEKILVIWIEDQTTLNIPLNQNLIQSTALTLILWLLREVRNCRRKLEGRRGWFTRFLERNHLHNVKEHGEAACAAVEVAASYPEELALIVNEGWVCVCACVCVCVQSLSHVQLLRPHGLQPTRLLYSWKWLN